MISNRSSLPGAVIVLAASILLLSSGCGEKKQIKGNEFVPRDDMVELMLDIHLLDAITNDVKYYRKYNVNDSVDLYGSVFEEHGYNKVIFDSTLAEYSRYPNLLDELYGEIMMRLNLMEDQLDQEQKERNDLKKKNLEDNDLKKKRPTPVS